MRDSGGGNGGCTDCCDDAMMTSDDGTGCILASGDAAGSVGGVGGCSVCSISSLIIGSICFFLGPLFLGSVKLFFWLFEIEVEL
jgi:hypothetical protein